MTTNETALREYQATLRELEQILAAAKSRAEHDDVPPMISYYVKTAKAMASRLQFLLPYLDTNVTTSG